jgi:hypothetical protein
VNEWGTVPQRFKAVQTDPQKKRGQGLFFAAVWYVVYFIDANRAYNEK